MTRSILAVAVAWLTVMAAPAAAQTADECPNGWSGDAAVEFAPPVPAVDSGVGNPERENGCTLLDDIWEPEPFGNHGAFVTHVERVTRDYEREGLLTAREGERVRAAAGRSKVGTSQDRQARRSSTTPTGIRT